MNTLEEKEKESDWLEELNRGIEALRHLHVIENEIIL